MALIQITAYVRNEHDLALWKALPNKTEWLHNHLSLDILKNTIDGQEIYKVTRPTGYNEAKYPLFTEPKLTPPEEVA